VLVGPVEITELAVALAEVEVQRRGEAAHRARQVGLCRLLVGDQAGGGQRSQIQASSSRKSSETSAMAWASAQRGKGSPLSPPPSFQISSHR
jgi:hypothetical protein